MNQSLEEECKNPCRPGNWSCWWAEEFFLLLDVFLQILGCLLGTLLSHFTACLNSSHRFLVLVLETCLKQSLTYKRQLTHRCENCSQTGNRNQSRMWNFPKICILETNLLLYECISCAAVSSEVSCRTMERISRGELTVTVSLCTLQHAPAKRGSL